MTTTGNILGFSINVVSGEFSPDYILKFILEFISVKFSYILENITQSDFDNQIESMILERKYPCNNLKESSSFLYHEISLYDYQRNGLKNPP